MAHQGLLLAALLAGAFLVMSSDAARTPLSRPPPRLSRPPPKSIRPPPKSIRPPPYVNKTPVNVTVFVVGEVALFTSHGDPTKNSSQPESVFNILPDADVYTSLVDKAGVLATSPVVSLRVDFGNRTESLITGDQVETPLTLTLAADLAEQLNLKNKASNSGRRRQLSEHQELARRMVLDYQNTRRSMAEFTELYTLLKLLGTAFLNQEPKAGDTKVLQNSFAKDLFIVNGQPQDISSLTFVFRSSSCGLFPKLNASRVRQFWYDSGDNTRQVATMERYYKSCTYDQLRFKRELNLVFDVDIPCIGTTARGPYDLRNGNGNKVNLDNELYGLLELGKEYLKNNNVDVFNRWASFRRKIMIFPFNYARDYAGFGGLASMGCAEGYDCMTWLNPSPYDSNIDLPVLFQELGHNIGLAHSSRMVCDANGCVKDEYGDWSDPMGSAWPVDWEKTLVCVTAPQAYKAGWASPIPNGELNVQSMTVGISRNFTIPAMALNKQNMLRIITNHSSTFSTDRRLPERALYVSYRARQSAFGSYDSGLQDDINNRVWIHEYNETANALPANYRTPPFVMSMMTDDLVRTPGTSIFGPPKVDTWGALPRTFSMAIGSRGGVRITLQRKTPAAATVSVCRFIATFENVTATPDACFNGIDDDCDGLIDADDPDCGLVPNPAPMPPPPPPPLPIWRKSPPPRPPPPSPSVPAPPKKKTRPIRGSR